VFPSQLNEATARAPHAQRAFGLVVWATFALVSRPTADSTGRRTAVPPRALAATQLALLLLVNSLSTRFVVRTVVEYPRVNPSEGPPSICDTSRSLTTNF